MSARLDALRAALAARGLDGWLVPHADEYQNESPPPASERLAWLTGFTGSAGSAVVLREAAAFFTDGRYTVQAAAQVDPAFARLNSTETTPAEWLEATAPAGARIGYDPWLHTTAELDSLTAGAARAGAELVPLSPNPIDALWTDRPPPPLAPIVPHPIRFAGTLSDEKRAALGATLAKDKVDAAVLTKPESIAWLLNVRGGDVDGTPLPLSTALLHADGHVDWFVDGAKLGPEMPAHLGNGVTVQPPARFLPALDALNGKRVRVDPGSAPVAVAARLTLADVVFDKGPDPTLAAKAAKTAAELAGMAAAHRRDGAALVRFLAWLDRAIQAGGTPPLESEAAAQLEAFRAGGEHHRGHSFPTISAAGPNAALPHYRCTPATDRRLEPGSLYLVDSGAQYLDGTTDVTRTIAVGPPSAEMRDRFTRVVKGHMAIARAVFPPGTSGLQLDALARQALWQAGLDYDHGTGHGVGAYLGVHEGPQSLSKRFIQVPLVPGMVLSNEPGFYKPGHWGIRIENLEVVTALPPIPGGERPMLGFQALTLAPIDRSLVDPALLDTGERAWLDAYHARVFDEIGPQLDPTDQAWLQAATRPLER